MDAFVHRHILKEIFDPVGGLLGGLIFMEGDLFFFQRADETLRRGILCRTAYGSHTDLAVGPGPWFSFSCNKKYLLFRRYIQYIYNFTLYLARRSNNNIV
jgi:hypothetical protein